MTSPKRSSLVVSLVAVFLLAGPALADSTSDPQGDVVDRSPCECSNYNQDLKSVEATGSGGDVTFTITQYGSMGTEFAAAYYGPQVAIFTTDTSSPAFGIIPRSDGQNHFKPTLVPASSFGAPCPGSPSTVGQGVTSSYNADFTSATYTIHLADIGNPSSFQWKVVNPAVPQCGVNPDDKATDIAPDSGLLTFGGTTTTPPPNNPPPSNPPPSTPPSTPPPTTPQTLDPLQTLPNLTGVPTTQALGSSVGGTINLEGPASQVNFDLFAPSGGASHAAAQVLIGHVVKRNVAAGPLKFKIALTRRTLKKLQKLRVIKLQLRVTIKLADGRTGVRKTTIKLKKKAKKKTAPTPTAPISYG